MRMQPRQGGLGTSRRRSSGGSFTWDNSVTIGPKPPCAVKLLRLGQIITVQDNISMPGPYPNGR